MCQLAAALGIDLGTSSVRAMLVARDGTPLATASRTYPILAPHPGWAEQDPDAWWLAVCDAIAACRVAAPDAHVEAVSLSGQMHGTVLVDRRGTPIRPAIIWADQRSAAEVDAFLARVGRDWLAAHTANPLATGFQLATLLWLARHEPESLRALGTVLLPKDYLRGRMTGTWATEASDACSTLLFDTAARRWSDDVIAAAGVDPAWLPPAAEATDRAGEIVPAAAEATGLAAGTPVIMGAGDQPATAVGNGVTEPGQVLSTIGSGGQLLAPATDAAYDPLLRTHTFCHAAKDRWYVMGAILSAGLSLRWLRDQVLAFATPKAAEALDYAALSAMAAEVPPGAEGLIFLPYLTGERTPHLDPHACGVFFGLSPRHTAAHLARAVMEGVVMALAEGLDIMRDLGIAPERVIAAGGGARSILWRQIQADVYGCPVTTSAVEEQAAYGAALVAGAGIGWWPSVRDACRACVRPGSEPLQPDARRRDFYAALRGLYRDLYPRLREAMAARARLVALRVR